MQRWMLLSIVVAIVLWLAATALEQRLQSGEGIPVPAGQEQVRQEEVLQEEERSESAAPPMSCEATESRLREVIDEARACETDDDCTLFDYGYPMDCMTAIAKSQVPLLREEYRRYDEACEFRVFYDCPTEPYVRLALCRDNRCVVELDTRQELRDSTLQRLNRRRPD